MSFFQKLIINDKNIVLNLMITINKLYNELIFNKNYILPKRRSKKQSHNYTKFPWFIKMEKKIAFDEYLWYYRNSR